MFIEKLEQFGQKKAQQRRKYTVQCLLKREEKCDLLFEDQNFMLYLFYRIFFPYKLFIKSFIQKCFYILDSRIKMPPWKSPGSLASLSSTSLVTSLAVRIRGADTDSKIFRNFIFSIPWKVFYI